MAVATPADSRAPDWHPSEAVPSGIGDCGGCIEEDLGDKFVGGGEDDGAVGVGDPGHEDEGEFGKDLEAGFGCAECSSGAEEIDDGALDKDCNAHDDEESGLVDFGVGHLPDEPEGELALPCHEEPAESKRGIDLPDIFVSIFFEYALFGGSGGGVSTK